MHISESRVFVAAVMDELTAGDVSENNEDGELSLREHPHLACRRKRGNGESLVGRCTIRNRWDPERLAYRMWCC